MRSMLEYFMTWRAVISMLFVRVLLAGMQLLSMYVLVNGTFVLALLLYRHVFATLCMAPLALYFERYMPFSYLVFGVCVCVCVWVCVFICVYINMLHITTEATLSHLAGPPGSGFLSMVLLGKQSSFCSVFFS